VPKLISQSLVQLFVTRYHTSWKIQPKSFAATTTKYN
jgi:hypothetical protein